MNPQPISARINLDEEAANRLKLRVFDSAVDYAIFTLDLAGVITTWNEGARRIFGWPLEEARGETGAIIFTPEDRDRGIPEKEIGVALKTGRSMDDRWHVRNDGTRFWASGEMLPLFDETGQAAGLMKIVRDRTEKWLHEQRQSAMLRLSDQLADLTEWPRMAEAAAESVGKGLNIAFAAYITFERDAPKMEGGWHHTLGSAVFADPPTVEIGEELRQGRPVSIADTGTRGLRWGGEVARAYAHVPLLERHQLAAVFSVYSPTPREWTPAELSFVRAVASRTRAAIERRKAEMALSTLAADLEREVTDRVAERNRLWASTSDLMATFDVDHKFVDLNPAWSSVLGLEADELIGRPLADVLQENDKQMMEDRLGSIPDCGAANGMLCHLRAWDGTTRIANCSLSLAGDRYYMVARDITAQMEMEDRLRQSQKMDALGQLTGGIAHDFNNLLMGITGSLDLIQARLDSGRTNDLARFMRAARTATRRAAALTHRLLVFARQQPLDPKPVDVNDLIAGMEELLRRTLHEGIRLNLVLHAHRWSALTDSHQLENAILNLVINARDAMPEGGELRITTEDCPLLDNDNAVRTGRLPPGDYVRISVADTGAGMPAEIQAKVFEPFFTTKPSGKGTGLGLSMIYGFVRQSEGDVTITSEVGRGTTVRLYLPRAEYSAVPVNPTPESRYLPGNGESIFVVEDDSTVRHLLGDVLNELGYRKVEASDGEAALAILRSDLHVDLLITDLGLPFVNGRQLAEVAREFRPHLKVLFVTGYVDDALKEKAHHEPHTWILDKPVGLEQLATKLSEIFTFSADKPGV